MKSCVEYHTRRTATHAAKSVLEEEGYEVRVLSRPEKKPGTITLIAWNRFGPLFICVRSYRSRYHHCEDIVVLSSLQGSGRYPGSIQYWVRYQGGWIRYAICEGGAVRVGSQDDVRL
ncbi:hypothetical protein [Methanospirillum lacunae]|uniref:Uncharacterized protein n=1 Tax=Methanospirillum lacunae TaxID=668570 RepID=A0A2V2N7Z8_9EURY|nr:hypothetical protein [Methanospirillum lacunae]PWR71403.1 hypothetical protein DK846_11090 [Methanospirillum lacunae]